VDAVITTLIGAAPQLGVGGILLTLLALLMRRESQDRADHRTEVAALAARHADDLKRIHESHAAELADLRADIKALREKRDTLNQRLDDERTRRRAAEDSMRPRHRRDPGTGS
jgi:hypothetical protein